MHLIGCLHVIVFTLTLYIRSIPGQETCKRATIAHCLPQVKHRLKLSGPSRPHRSPICWRSVWKMRCAHSLAQWDVATPAPNWSLSFWCRLHSLICICHICQKEKTLQWEHDESKTGQRHNPLPYNFWTGMIECSFLLALSLDTNCI